MTKKSTLTECFLFTVGDWSHDGHNLTEDVFVKCNMKYEKLHEVLFTQKIIDIEKECADYEDGILSEECTQRLLDLGIIKKDELNEEGVYEDMYPDAWVDTLLNVVKHLDPIFEFEVVTFPTFHCGGYGLFSC